MTQVGLKLPSPADIAAQEANDKATAKMTVGERARALAQSVITAATGGVTFKNRIYLYRHSDPAFAGDRYEEELVRAAVGYLVATGWKATCHRPWFWEQHVGSKPGDGFVEWVVKISK